MAGTPNGYAGIAVGHCRQARSRLGTGAAYLREDSLHVVRQHFAQVQQQSLHRADFGFGKTRRLKWVRVDSSNRSMVGIEKRLQDLMAIFKNPVQIGRDQEVLHEAATRHRVLNIIADQSAAFIFDECVLMYP